MHTIYPNCFFLFWWTNAVNISREQLVCSFFSSTGGRFFWCTCFFNLPTSGGVGHPAWWRVFPLREVTWLSFLSRMFLQFLFQLQKLFSQHTSASGWCTEYPRRQSIFFYREVIYNCYLLHDLQLSFNCTCCLASMQATLHSLHWVRVSHTMEQRFSPKGSDL